MIRPATDGTKAVEPGISLRTVHFLVPGGQMQWDLQLIAGSSSGLLGCSVEYTTFRLLIFLFRHSLRITLASGQTDVR